MIFLILNSFILVLAFFPGISLQQFCSPNPCRNGNCVVNSNGYGFSCQCLTGYTGQLCDDLLVNPCSPNPCYNFGICSSNDGQTFKCTCSPNYTGVRCEKSVTQATSSCLSSPCFNGGTCQNSNQVGSSYICVCPVTFTGLRCETAIQSTQTQNPCLSNPCAAGSTCLFNIQTSINPIFICLCAPNYTGTLCNQLITNPGITQTACSSSPCVNGGTCVPITQGNINPPYACICPITYTGNRCEIFVGATSTAPSTVNPCLSNPCAAGSSCLFNIQTNINPIFICLCPPNYTGTLCNQLITNPGTTQNSCSSSPCINGGTCIPITQANINPPYACVCPQTYTGIRCEIYVNIIVTTVPTTVVYNPCSTNPCNFGRCLPITQPSTVSYVCICNPNYTGLNCNQLIITTTSTAIVANPCLSTPCYNGGSCVAINQPNVQPYACLCVLGYTGQRCETQTVIQNACSSNPCALGSTCVPNTYSNTYSCLCLPNYTGRTCNNLIQPPTTTTSTVLYNPCAYSQCSFGSTCIPNNLLNTYTCLCPPSYTGSLCNNYIQPQTTTQIPSPCLSNPCLSGGTCVSSSFGYTCTCPIGYIGNRCEQRQFIDLCNTNTCYNGGTCQTQSRGQDQYTVVCFCPSGFTGSRCQTSTTQPLTTLSPIITIPTYAPVICQCLNNGVCKSDGTCSCPANFFGTRCEYQNIYQPTTVSTSTSSVCPTGLCVNGRCAQIPQGGAYYCICNLGWTGPRCNVRNYCQSYTAVCQNGGTCVNNQNGFSCSCNVAYTGNYCENAVSNQITNPTTSACQQNVCLSGGTCYLSNGNPTCQCQRGYIGLRCEQDICKQALIVGPCYQSITRYYYNSQTKQCQTFNYGGCNGNENNFGSLEACNSNCLGH